MSCLETYLTYHCRYTDFGSGAIILILRVLSKNKLAVCQSGTLINFNVLKIAQ